MEELEALESTFAELEGAPGSSLPPLPPEFQNWHNARAANENMSRSRYVFIFNACLLQHSQPLPLHTGVLYLWLHLLACFA